MSQTFTAYFRRMGHENNSIYGDGYTGTRNFSDAGQRRADRRRRRLRPRCDRSARGQGSHQQDYRIPERADRSHHRQTERSHGPGNQAAEPGTRALGSDPHATHKESRNDTVEYSNDAGRGAAEAVADATG